MWWPGGSSRYRRLVGEETGKPDAHNDRCEEHVLALHRATVLPELSTFIAEFCVWQRAVGTDSTEVRPPYTDGCGHEVYVH